MRVTGHGLPKPLSINGFCFHFYLHVLTLMNSNPSLTLLRHLLCRIPVSSMKSFWESGSEQLRIYLCHRSGRLFHLTPGGITHPGFLHLCDLLNYKREVLQNEASCEHCMHPIFTNSCCCGQFSSIRSVMLVRWHYAGVEFEDPKIPFGQFGTMRLAASVDFPRQLPLQEGEQPFRLRIMRLGVKSRIM